MAGNELIDTYLQQVAERLGRRPDAPDVVGELADHLFSAVESRVSAGADEVTATKAALAEMGDPGAVATAIRAEAGTPALPTRFTVSVGSANVVAAALWIAVVVAWATGELVSGATQGDDWGTGASVIWISGGLALMAAMSLTLLFGLALRVRHGGLGWIGTTGLVLLALAVPATFVAWAFSFWATLLGLGAVAVTVPVLRAGIIPRAPMVAFALAVPVGAGVYALMELAAVGRVDEWGDRPAALLGGLLAGTAVLGIALVGSGRRLRGEVPVDAPGLPAARA